MLKEFVRLLVFSWFSSLWQATSSTECTRLVPVYQYWCQCFLRLQSRLLIVWSNTKNLPGKWKMGRSETILLYVICYEGLGVLDQFKIPKIHTMFRTKDKCYRANSLYQTLLLLNSWSTNNSSSKLNQSCRQIYPFNRLKKKIHTLLRTT